MIQMKKPSGRFVFAKGFAPFQQNSRKSKGELSETWAGNLGPSKTSSSLHGKKSEMEFKVKIGKKHFSARRQNFCRGCGGRRKQGIFYAS